MGLFDSVFSTFDNAISDVFGSSSGSVLGGSDTGGGSSFPVNGPVYGLPGEPYPMPQAYPTAAGTPMIPGALGGVARWAFQFPNLWQALQRLRANYRLAITPQKLWSMFKNLGPAGLAAIIGAAAVNELIMFHSTHKRRRMNVANTTALRRSVRRLKGFDRLSNRVSAQLARASGRRRSRGRCTTCRKSPCSC